MAQVGNLSAAPIQEAILDFVVDGAPLSELKVREVANLLRAGSDWLLQEIRTVQVTFDTVDPTKNVQQHSFEGVRVTSPDEKVIVQLRPSRVTASFVRSYTHWEDLEALALRCLATFGSVAGSNVVTRIGARFINILKIAVDLPTTLVVSPISVAKDGDVTDFVQTHVIRFPRSKVAANFTMATVLHPFEENQPTKGLMLDVDSYVEGVFDIAAGALTGELASLRKVKNELFFGAVTDAALEIYR